MKAATTIFFSIVFSIIFLSNLFALRAAPESYTVVSKDEKYVFVMLVSNKWKKNFEIYRLEREKDEWWSNQNSETKEKIINAEEQREKIQSKYRKSGLYKNDGSDTPLWTINWYASNLYLSSDGKHIVIIKSNDWPDALDVNQIKDLKAVAFYEKSKLIKEYRMKDLMTDATRFTGWKDILFDDSSGTLSLIDTKERKYIFHIINGEIIEKPSI